MSEGYGDLPQAPQPQGGWDYPQPQRGDAPPPVLNAARLMLLRCAIGVVSVIVLFATKGDLKKRILAKTPNATQSTIDTALYVGVVIAIVILVFYVFLAFKVRAGANWARIVTWVFAGLGILGVLLGLAQPTPPLSRTVSIIEGLIDVAVVILLAQGSSNRYFRAGRRAY